MQVTSEEKKDALLHSAEMAPVEGTVDVDIPIAELWRFFLHARLWPSWNRCFFWVHNKVLAAGATLIWAFQPIRWYYLYKMFAMARIVELEPERKVTWEVTVLPGFYARHTYHMEDLGEGRTRFGSWEQATGLQIRFPLTHRFWVAHFTFVKNKSLEGARELEAIYRREGSLDPSHLSAGKARLLRPIALALVALIIAVFAWFYEAYVKFSVAEIVPGVTVVLGAGGNSTLIEDSHQLLLVDTKFPPGSSMLRRLIARRWDAPVTSIVDTHYHYDHTFGNSEYPGAKIYAEQGVPGFMMKHDGLWWRRHPAGVPTVLIGQDTTIMLGTQAVELSPATGHTTGDLYVMLHRGGKDIIATGDLVFNTYFPMIDLSGEGSHLDALEAIVTKLAAQYPEGIFIPGHGPIATAGDLKHYASYIQALRDGVEHALKSGLNARQTEAALDLSPWDLRPLPSPHDWRLCWSTAAHDIRWAYQLESGTRAKPDCNF